MIKVSHLTTDEKDIDLKKVESDSELYRRLLYRIVDKRLTAFQKTPITELDDVNWHLKRAYRDGYIEAYKDLINLVTDTKPKE